MKYTVRIGKDALKQLEDITDRRIRQEIFDRIKELANDPEQQGKPLKNELAGLRSVRVVHQRFRIIYEVQRKQVLVIVVAVGLRKEGDRADIFRKAALLNRTYNRFWRKDSK
ncbi:MAG: type II toxin-antitoxin system RelE/ParE family toxin [Ktedonobacteraceae bacterium]